MFIAVKCFLRYSELIWQGERPPTPQQKYLGSSLVHGFTWGCFPFPSSATSLGTHLSWAPDWADIKSWKKKNIKTQNPAEFLKIRFPVLCCGLWHSLLSHQARYDQALQVSPHLSACPPEQHEQNPSRRREKKHRIGWLEFFSVRLEFIKKMNTSLGGKLGFPLVETSGQDEVFLNEPAEQLFCFLCHFPYYVIAFAWALQGFLHTEFLRMLFPLPY